MAADGVLIVTATGMLGAFMIPTELPYLNNQSGGQGGGIQNQSQQQGPFTLPTVTESLGHTRNYITTADISFGKSKIVLLHT